MEQPSVVWLRDNLELWVAHRFRVGEIRKKDTKCGHAAAAHQVRESASVEV